jgi:hypothetical protein
MKVEGRSMNKLLLVLAFVCTQTSAADYLVFMKGRDLHDWQTDESKVAQVAALAYIQGVVDVLSIQKVLCAPKMNGYELAGVVKAYNEAHPERWDYNAADVVYWATMPLWACRNRV